MNVSPVSSDSYVVVEKNDTRVRDFVMYVQKPLYERPNDNFQGREDYLQKMDAKLLPPFVSTESCQGLP